ncbi:MAG: DUF2232 domain-containing protein [Gammaproteobacteria bacterium]|nr:DUF2232 domain-containing protein [Gammaproteobacteria bacterium]
MAASGISLLGRRGPRIALMALLFPLPLLAIASAGITVLTAARQGWRVAMTDALMASVLLALLTALAGGFWLQLGLGALLSWLLAAALGHLRSIGSLNLAVQATVLLGFAGALGFIAWNSDPEAYWEDILVDLAERARAVGLDLGPDDLLPTAAQLMTGMMSASAVASALGALFLGSWWAGAQTGMRFADEFRRLRMGRVLGLVAAVVGALLLTGLRTGADDLLLVLGVGFVVQGLAVLHWLGARHNWPGLWPLAVYLPLALVPALAAFELVGLALLGLIDNGYSLRRAGGELV